MSGGGAETEGERESQAVSAVSPEPDVGLNPMNHEVMTWAEIKGRMFNQLSHQVSQHLCLKSSDKKTVHLNYPNKLFFTSRAVFTELNLR